MKKNILLAIIVSLVVGGAIGYALNDKTPEAQAPASPTIDHSTMDMNDQGMEAMMMDMTARMEGKSGDDLDRIFLEDMIIHHQGAVDMAIIIQENTERPELKTFAQDIIDAQSKEIVMMKDWLADWFLEEEN